MPSRKKEGHGNLGRGDTRSPQPEYYTHWEVDEDEEDENELRSAGATTTTRNQIQNQNQNPNLHQQNQTHTGNNHMRQEHQESSRTKNGGGVYVGSRSDSNIPRQKFNVEFDYEDTIETSSSGSFSSDYGRPSHHSQRQTQTHSKTQARNFTEDTHPQQHQPHYSRHMNKGSHHHGPRMAEIPEKFRDDKDGSEIYVMDSAYVKPQPPPSVYSHYSGKSRAPSEMSSVKTKTSRKGGVVVETMSAPNPCCPNTKGVCCLLVLINLGLILVTLGFSIVLQLFDPPFVWYCGIAFLIVGFTALIASLIFCLHLCRESESQRRRGLQPGEMYWTHHWQKRIALPGMTRNEVEKADDVSTVYSARNEPDDKYYTREDRRDMTPIHTYNHN